MKTIIYLVRHGNSTGNVQKKVIGVTDVMLTKEGVKQGKAVAKFFRDKKLDAVYSSNLTRAEVTALYTAKSKNLPLFIDKRFGEMNFGEEYENITWTEALAKVDDSYRRYRDPVQFVYVKFPRGGENGVEVVARMVEALSDIDKKHTGGSVMVTTHSVALMMLLSYLKNGCKVEGMKRAYRLPNASVTTLEIENGEIRLTLEGCVSHLGKITV
jgi:broad specificity phosphatase PhoE